MTHSLRFSTCFLPHPVFHCIFYTCDLLVVFFLFKSFLSYPFTDSKGELSSSGLGVLTLCCCPLFSFLCLVLGVNLLVVLSRSVKLWEK